MKTHNWFAVYDMACFGFVLAQVRPLSDSWQDIRLSAGLVPAALLLSLFNSLHSSILLEELMSDGLSHTVNRQHFILMSLEHKR